MADEKEIEAATEAMMDSMEAQNKERGVFGGVFPRDKYRDGLRRHVVAVLVAAEAVRQSSSVAAEKS